jgi:hypothetical protein
LDITNVSGGIARLTAATGGMVVFSGTMAGAGGVTKTGDITVESTGDFSYTGLKGSLSAPDGVVVNNSLNEIQLTVIPEPASLGTLGILALAALLRRRLRR